MRRGVTPCAARITMGCGRGQGQARGGRVVARAAGTRLRRGPRGVFMTDM